MATKAKLLFGDTVIDAGGLGGLLRCCIASVHEYVEEHAEETAPDTLVISCLHESEKDSGNIILESGVWRWNQE